MTLACSLTNRWWMTITAASLLPKGSLLISSPGGRLLILSGENPEVVPLHGRVHILIHCDGMHYLKIGSQQN